MSEYALKFDWRHTYTWMTRLARLAPRLPPTLHDAGKPCIHCHCPTATYTKCDVLGVLRKGRASMPAPSLMSSLRLIGRPMLTRCYRTRFRRKRKHWSKSEVIEVRVMVGIVLIQVRANQPPDWQSRLSEPRSTIRMEMTASPLLSRTHALGPFVASSPLLCRLSSMQSTRSTCSWSRMRY